MKFDMDYIAHNNALTESNPYFKLFLTIILLIVTLALDNLFFDVVVIIIMSIVILLIAKINYKSYLKFLKIFFLLKIFKKKEKWIKKNYSSLPCPLQ